MPMLFLGPESSEIRAEFKALKLSFPLVEYRYNCSEIVRNEKAAVVAVFDKVMNLELSKQKPGLMYDADAVTLLGKFSDELSAHRAKRQWAEVLSSYFLLEKERDYDMWVTTNAANGYFVLSCCFISACGRYAFWRLINHQAPEAEQHLGGSFGNTPAKRFLSSVRQEEEKKWVFSALSDQADENEYNARLIDRIIKLFQ